MAARDVLENLVDRYEAANRAGNPSIDAVVDSYVGTLEPRYQTQLSVDSYKRFLNEYSSVRAVPGKVGGGLLGMICGSFLGGFFGLNLIGGLLGGYIGYKRGRRYWKRKDVDRLIQRYVSDIFPGEAEATQPAVRRGYGWLPV